MVCADPSWWRLANRLRGKVPRPVGSSHETSHPAAMHRHAWQSGSVDCLRGAWYIRVAKASRCEETMLEVGLVPLDERPVNTRYPRMLAELAGATLHLPPPDVLSDQRRPADGAALTGWLRARAPRLDVLVVDLGMLAFGGLIASRITDDSAAMALARLEILAELRRDHPTLTIAAFNVIMRISNADDAVEEPEYWARYGTRLYQLSQWLDRHSRGEPVDAELAAARAAVPTEVATDMLARRLRNHTLNLAAIDLLQRGVIDQLVLSSDDTSPVGLGSREKRWIQEWVALLQLDHDPRLSIYPGADEVGSVLVARAILQHAGMVPRFRVDYADSAGAAIVAPYEDGPIATTIVRQVAALGGTLVESDETIVLAVNPPVPRRSEWHPAHAATERADRSPALAALVARGVAARRAGQLVALADVAYPNGADPALIEQLGALAPYLCAYGAWNTAGNTIGVVLAQAALVQLSGDSAAARRFLAHRFVEDWAYQQEVRRAARAYLLRTSDVDDLDATLEGPMRTWVEHQLTATMAQVPWLADWRIVPGSVCFPWHRLFEVDFELAPA